ncbi:MAG: dihydrolipoyl dehydrogenase [Acidobacteria bacterium]|nr:dihydrolipoyl dehydrogenase [Acidobacteriota bacterium]
MTQHDLLVIGAGPGGYVAAVRAAQLGLDVACVEKEQALGGTCLRIGCIPSKAMLESSERYAEARKDFAQHGIVLGDVGLDLKKMLKRKERVIKTSTSGVDYLFKKNKITRYLGHATFLDRSRVQVSGGDTDTEIEAKNIIIATGSKVATLPGVNLDGDRIASSTEALSYDEVPEHLVVIGAGYIGLEMGSVWLRLGSRVTVLEYLDRILPGMDAEMANEAHTLFKKQGMVFELGSKVTGVRVEGDHAIVERNGADPIECDRVLIAVGRKPHTDNLGLDAIGLELDELGRIPVNDHFATPIEGVYAIGDVIRGVMLAHKAEEEGVACVEHIVNGYGHVNYNAIPGIVYTHPEVASVGRTEEELQDAGIEYRKGTYPFRANGRARALAQLDGNVKILADAKTDRVLGVHIIGPRAGDLIAEAAVAIEFGASSEDIARTSHAHPTLAEAVKEAALDVDDRAINI